MVVSERAGIVIRRFIWPLELTRHSIGNSIPGIELVAFKQKVRSSEIVLGRTIIVVNTQCSQRQCRFVCRIGQSSRDTDGLRVSYRPHRQVVYGRMGPRAVVTAEDGYPDLFLDAVYFLDLATGDLVEDEDCSGQVILGSEIATITFYVNPLMRGEFDEDDGDDDTATSTET